MELVSKNGSVLATEQELWNGFCLKGNLKVRLSLDVPIISQVGNEKMVYFLLDENFSIINNDSTRFFLQPDQEVYLFKTQFTLSDKKKIIKTEVLYKKISFEFDDETSTFYIVGLRDFEKAPAEFEKKLRKDKILV